ncbi:hypothetical protein ETAA8_62380 [Anatilimnocola aggregata]|uniref:Uncharacterized protein n=1 Tax=Anatilimnocola aggregata TaxID=2528021 RepID=A0A517YLH9_9BACT|nr:hypothetical protein [Anatilimnocola aggregata]QDU31085.1 hypothetical protein ETAA8_62380 [Anatilimnocola aggregata]
MIDPHLVSLHYQLETQATIKFDDPPPLDGNQTEFAYRLESGRLTVMMKQHCATEEAARNIVEPFLRSWELDFAIRRNSRAITFLFEKSEIIDLAPLPPDGSVRCIAGTAHLTLTAYAPTVVAGFKDYPEPPTNFKASSDVENMWFRYARFLEDREPLLSMAYACLTVIEGSTGLKGNQGARDGAARMYAVDRQVLKHLGELVSTKGGPAEARKFDAGATLQELTNAERGWVAAAVRLLIRRKGEYDANPGSTLTQLTMGDIQ